uniref:C2H2-type domain-containing protein n=1 Tax=Timema shepardi TaxID=629360 RepID=A0A7R9AYE8_TIMSH|nr:unnamed protein product [Timema shepardi]
MLQWGRGGSSTNMKTLSNITFPCNVCNKTFAKSSNLWRHIRVVHELEPDVGAHKNFKCTLCPYATYNARKLRDHLGTVHGTKSASEGPICHEFSSIDEFKIWKHSVEESTASYFVQERGKQKMADGSAAINFVCHRSGSYAPKGFGKRPLKREGSCKMGNRCTAEVICRIYPDNQVKVTYYDLHHGHNMDGRHLKMTRKERAMYRCRIMGKRSSDRVKKIKKQPSTCVKIENKPIVNSSDLVLPLTICEISNSENGNEMPVAIDLASDNSKYTNLNESVSSSHTNLNEAIDKKLLHALALLRDRNVLDDKTTQLVTSHLDAVVLLLEGSKDSAPLPTRSHEQPHSEYSSRRNKTTSKDNAITAATPTHKTTNPQCFVLHFVIGVLGRELHFAKRVVRVVAILDISCSEHALVIRRWRSCNWYYLSEGITVLYLVQQGEGGGQKVHGKQTVLRDVQTLQGKSQMMLEDPK